MVKKGDRIENPVTGETFLYLQTAQDTAGELLQVELKVRPGGFVAAPHIHPKQEERFVVQKGTIRLHIGDEERLVGNGQEAVVPAGTPHVWWNGGEDELEALVEFRPALQIQEIFPTLFALARDGRTNKKGVPNLLQTAVTLGKYRDMIYLANPPVVVQKILFAILGPFARLLGYRADYPECPQAAVEKAGMLEAPHYSGC